MTDTCGNDDNKVSNNDQMQSERDDNSVIQNPLFSRPLGPDDINENQMKRMQLSENDRAVIGRVKAQGNFIDHVHKSYSKIITHSISGWRSVSS